MVAVDVEDPVGGVEVVEGPVVGGHVLHADGLVGGVDVVVHAELVLVRVPVELPTDDVGVPGRVDVQVDVRNRVEIFYYVWMFRWMLRYALSFFITYVFCVWVDGRRGVDATSFFCMTSCGCLCGCYESCRVFSCVDRWDFVSLLYSLCSSGRLRVSRNYKHYLLCVFMYLCVLYSNQLCLYYMHVRLSLFLDVCFLFNICRQSYLH